MRGCRQVRKGVAEDSSASAHIIAFVVAGALFISSVGMVVFTARQVPSDDAGVQEASQQSAANRLADLLVSSPGVGWSSDADALDRLGLGATNGSGLQQSSIDHLRGAMFTKADNGLLDYEEARHGFGFPEGGPQNFHVRIYPVGMETLAGTVDLSHIRTAYIGDWVSLGTVTLTDASGTVNTPLPTGSSAVAYAGSTAHQETQLMPLGVLGGAGGSTASTVTSTTTTSTTTGTVANTTSATVAVTTTSRLAVQLTLEKQAQSEVNATMFSLTAHERTMLRKLHLGYNDKVHITTSAPTILVKQNAPLPSPVAFLDAVQKTLIPGDVYPDTKSYIDSNLPSRLSQYNLLIVGSGVDQNALTSNAVKSAIADWVADGGDLVVLGTDAQNYQWLQPLFSVGVKTVNGAPTAPDVSHPLLREPYHLDWTSYPTHNKAWDIKSNSGAGGYDAFNHVIVTSGSDILAISKDGGFGPGRVTLTTFLPREIYTTNPTEAQNFVTNIVLYSDRAGLYLDYGPTHPADTPVAVTVRDSWLWDSKLGQVPIRIQVDVWGMA